MKKKNNKFLLYAVAGLIILLIMLSFVYYYQKYFGQNFKNALLAQNSSNICQPPAGYTEEQWKEHVSHHPDIYAQCLQ